MINLHAKSTRLTGRSTLAQTTRPMGRHGVEYFTRSELTKYEKRVQGKQSRRVFMTNFNLRLAVLVCRCVSFYSKVPCEHLASRYELNSGASNSIRILSSFNNSNRSSNCSVSKSGIRYISN